ncbi:NAD-dependent epimerase/dehydratase family protein [Rhizobium phaseoli]|uniref:NAD-dependent epimerase/dehydratase family protein n=2 Tax=Rhizobium TaxID=379 RepID=A0A192TER1_9HYPH|nr:MULTISPECIES: SDR family oxidoreductase [Rhizobium]ACE91944.1 putative UDP-glucose 4-epimerase protein [Rhizobium etli CIAT 652]ANL28807.1 NAD-dependent epimerase/dehydratase family protein [Rhizobium phaseoli]ANL41342.1 NAD-dependent epimerase/dehydratase family protein [Rhizobium phaseoli]ANL54077.1 NAD-dependent epimerase/dehydratase family protein [Rhizobium phaseoli]ANL60330.1 NAD-dependent epimerase/dehydratase family protein [Rhizobium phaseoli]
MRCLVTGAAGFVGSPLVERLHAEKICDLVVTTRSQTSVFPDDVRHFPIEMTDSTDWTAALAGVDVILHLAARVHIMNDRAADPLAEFRRTNTAATLNLAEQAARAGVKRFVFVSTIKVNGEENNRPFRHDDAPMPIDPYGISKLESEIGLREIAARTGMEVVIIRPPLVYGPGARGNFALLVGLVRKRIPLPFASLKNRRTLVAVQNLVDLIITCAAHPAAGGEIFLAGDGEDLSTPELIRGIAAGLGVKPMLIPFPSALLHMAAKAVGKEAVYQRLCGSLQVDMSQARKVLGWTPVVTPRQGLKLAVK